MRKGDEDTVFLRTYLLELQEELKWLVELCPQDVTSDKDLLFTSENAEHCAHIADKYGFDGSVFRNLFFPDVNASRGSAYADYIKKSRQQIRLLPQIIAEIKKNIGFSDIEPPPEILVKLTKRSRQILQFLWDGQITSIDALVRHVYFDKACTPDAIRKAINRLNDSLVEHTSGKLEVKTQDKNVWLARIE